MWKIYFDKIIHHSCLNKVFKLLENWSLWVNSLSHGRYKSCGKCRQDVFILFASVALFLLSFVCSLICLYVFFLCSFVCLFIYFVLLYCLQVSFVLSLVWNQIPFFSQLHNSCLCIPCLCAHPRASHFSFRLKKRLGFDKRRKEEGNRNLSFKFLRILQ